MHEIELFPLKIALLYDYLINLSDEVTMDE